MDALEKAKKIVEIADSKKAYGTELIKIDDVSSVTDYFVICNGNSETQVKAIADEIEFKMKENYKTMPLHTEGYKTSTWILLDYNDVVVHIFNQEARSFYSLEKLWSDAKRIDISDIIKEN